ncbi:MAG: type 2 isopentenyl-diphosphate Delta-isomerase [Chloroflexi bacterium]|nr:type 2 isopentenyl-diphosphate Delta-isomerase [Chloroflexota bacterium]MCL5275664.1 type 2 isopentenyl-diphosphate Delta-isomerase [Chloroflexota bacterium]
MTQGILEQRKSDHIRINLEQDVASRTTTGLEKLRFEHQALPELDMRVIDLGLDIFGKHLNGPLLISCMTGGTEEARQINRNLAIAAQAAGVAMGLGSMRAAVARPELAPTFQVRDVAPDIVLFANIGAVQLNYGFTVQQCRDAVDLAQADALVLHLNPLQEALQPEGDVNWSNLLRKIEDAVKAMPVPVIAKEVGWGISQQAARQLVEAGVSGIDVAGAGGTSWSQVEMHRAKTDIQRRVAAAFADWGISTVESLRNVRAVAPYVPVIASGGLKNGVDGAKCIALGAAMFGMAAPFLHAATLSEQAVYDEVEILLRQLRVTMLCVGAADLMALRRVALAE